MIIWNVLLARWIGFRLELLGALVVLAAAFFAVIASNNKSLTAGMVGLSLSYAMQVSLKDTFKPDCFDLDIFRFPIENVFLFWNISILNFFLRNMLWGKHFLLQYLFQKIHNFTHKNIINFPSMLYWNHSNLIIKDKFDYER